jgi:AraC family transcriptional regulator
MEWLQSLNRAIDFMEEHLTDNITCEDVAEHIYISSFHFQRTFNLLTGLTIGEYLRNRRLSLAGQDLLKGNNKVIDVALKYCYETPESFSKAFSRFHGITPNQAKKEGSVLKSFNPLVIKIKLEGGSTMDYRIVKKDSFKLVAKTRLFSNETSQTEIPKFWSEYYNTGLANKVCGMMGICLQSKNDARTWSYGIGCEEKYVKEIPEDFEILEIPAYTWAIFTCVGPMPDGIQNMWERVYSEWLPQADYELIPDYDIEYYTEGDNTKEDYVSEIWIPVKEKKNRI